MILNKKEEYFKKSCNKLYISFFFSLLYIVLCLFMEYYVSYKVNLIKVDYVKIIQSDYIQSLPNKEKEDFNMILKKQVIKSDLEKFSILETARTLKKLNKEMKNETIK